MSYCQEIKQSKEFFHSHKTPSQTSRPTWQFSDSEQSEKEDFGLAIPDFIGCFFGVRVRTAQKAGANAMIRARTLLSRKPYTLSCDT